MTNSNKNISVLIIITCLISIVICIFLPKQEKKESQVPKLLSEKEVYFPIPNRVFQSPFKGEKISVIKLEGIISDSAGTSFIKDLTSSPYVLELINKATQDSLIKAIVIRVNSPGGTVAASQELYHAIYNAKKKKPVVITMGDVAASGGYYIASAADIIYANPGTLTGSIGVITSYLNFYDLLTKIGVKGIVIKSGEFKDIGNPTRPLTEEERKILQDLLDSSYNQFISDVAKGRKMPIEKVKAAAKGLIYTGTQAKNAGLVDYIGDFSKAIKHAQRLAKERFPELKRRYGDKDIPIVESWKGASLLDALIGAIHSSINPSATIIEHRLFKPYVYSKYQPLWLLE